MLESDTHAARVMQYFPGHFHRTSGSGGCGSIPSTSIILLWVIRSYFLPPLVFQHLRL